MTQSPPEGDLAQNVWEALTLQAGEADRRSPVLGAALRRSVLRHSSLAEGLAALLADALRGFAPADFDLARVATIALRARVDIAQSAAADLTKLDAVNPACPDLLTGFLSFRGFQALQLYRVANAIWTEGDQQLATLLQNWGAMKFAMDIHPAAKIGKSVFFDHGMGLVVGSTAVIEDGVNMWHGVTLGSTLTQAGDRHPKIRKDATICAGATILGNIEVGAGAIVAASSVVLKSVPPGAVVAGIPARVVGQAPQRLAAIDEESKSESIQAQEA